jgi:imidazolonepropionase-like amidohydrolase
MVKYKVTFIPALTQQGDILNLLGEKELKAYLEDPLVQRGLSNIMKRSLEDRNGVIQRFRSSLNEDAGGFIRRQLEEQQKRAFENVQKAKASGIKIAMGTGAGNLLIFPGASVHRELQLLVKAGLTPVEAIVAATQNTAALLGKGAEYGTIEPGKAADLLILDADPLADIRNTEKLQTVIHRGRVVPLGEPPTQ